MRVRSALALTIVAGLAPIAGAQVDKPKFYVWSAGGLPYTESGSTRTYVNTPDLTPMVWVYNVLDQANSPVITDPENTALEVAKEVYRRTRSGAPDPLTEENVVFSFFTFGRDDISLRYRLDAAGDVIVDSNGRPLAPIGGFDCDSAAARAYSGIVEVNGSVETETDDDGRYVDSAVRFFTENDRILLDANDQGLDENFGFPDSHGRRYRNPVMLENANPDPNNFPPLKQYMDDFCTEYVSIQQDPNHDFWRQDVPNPRTRPANPPYLPDPVRMHLDNETHDGIAWVMSNNDLHMLSVLAGTDDPNTTTDDNSAYNYWANPSHKVPGTDKTLKQLYADAVQEYEGLPDYILDSETGLQANFSNPAHTADNDRNRPFMLWYADVCRQARNAVMENCFYGVVKNYWDGDCKTSNYDDGKTDGLIDKTGLFKDSNGTKNQGTYPLRVNSNELPRGWTSNFGGLAGRYWEETTGTWNVHRTFCSADMSSPVTYKLHPNDFLGHAGNPGFGDPNNTTAHNACAQQPNLYMMVFDSTGEEVNVNETIDETSLRLVRHRLESCQASNNRAHETEIVPWVAMMHETRQTPKYTRDVMAMLRSHKVSEVIMFCGRNVESPDPEVRAAAAKSWKGSQPIIDQVYSPYVWSYDRVNGTLPSGETTSQDPDKLEYVTVGAAATPATVNVDSEVFEYDGSNLLGTTLGVEVRGLYNSETGKGYFSTFQSNTVDPNISYGYTLYMECSIVPDQVDHGGFYGIVEVMDWNSGDWKQVRIIDSSQDETHQPTPPRIPHSHGLAYNLPSAEAGGVKSTRIAIDIRSSADLESGAPLYNFVSTATMYSHHGQTVETVRGAMRLRLTHFAVNPEDTFTSKYDLVQVVPFPFYMEATVNGQPGGVAGSITLGETEGEYGIGRDGTGPTLENSHTDFTFGPVDTEAFPHAPEYYKNPIIEKSESLALWEPAQLDDVTCSPAHYAQWNASNETGANWPAGYDATDEVIPSTRVLNSLFSLPTETVTLPDSTVVAKQKVTARFTSPIWTNAPAESETNLVTQPYTVWFWLTPTMQWQDVTAAMDVRISRDPDNQCREVVISSKATTPFQAGFYALVLNVIPPAIIDEPDCEAYEQYAVFCGGTTEEPGPAPIANESVISYYPTFHSVPIIQYNFRLYPDCNQDYAIDSTPLMCNLGGGTNCPADMDDGSGTGTEDDAVDINDLLYFLAKFEVGHLDADLDDGWGTGNPDNGVDINDLIFFLNHFAAGC